PTHLILSLPASKTDPFRKGVSILVAAAPDTRLTALGLDSSKYSGHSFRRGAATSAAAVGYADHEIQLLGRWRSDAYKLYID
ncbi:hypothetical protein BC628DRAFT_1276145, partial [Trametes gibbosa]